MCNALWKANITMSTSEKTLSIGIDLSAAGAHIVGRHSGGLSGGFPYDEERLNELVLAAERGTLDFVALGENFRLEADGNQPRSGALDAAVATARLAKRTTHIGFVPTISTSHIAAHHLAAAVTALDHASSGRAAWQTSAQAPAKTITAVRRTWAANHDAPAPVVVRVGNDETLAIAARHADVARILAFDIASAQAQRAALREQAAAAGRNPDDIRVLVELFVVTGPNQECAQARLDLLNDIDGGRARERSISFVGTPGGLADLMEAWFIGGAVDGFVVTPSSLHVDLFGLVDGVVPFLRESGLFRSKYPTRKVAATLGLRTNRKRALTSV